MNSLNCDNCLIVQLIFLKCNQFAVGSY